MKPHPPAATFPCTTPDEFAKLAEERGNDKPACGQCGTEEAAVYMAMEGGIGDPRPWWLCAQCWSA